MTLLRGLLLLLLMALPLRAEEFPAPLSVHVSDFAPILDPETTARLTAHLSALREDPGVEVAIVTIGSQSDFGDHGDLAALGKALFNHWGIGNPQRNDGVLVLMAVEDREIRIALGTGYPPVWDGRAQRVIDALILPAFHEGRYGEGLEAGLAGLETHLIRPFRAGITFEGTEGMPDAPQGMSAIPFLLIVTAAIAWTIGWPRRYRILDAIALRRACPACGTHGVFIERTTGDDGRTLVVRRCPQCGHASERFEGRGDGSHGEGGHDSASGGGSSSGDFGGGSSGGGGASGRW